MGKIRDRTGASVWAVRSPSPERVQAPSGVPDPGAIGGGVFFPQAMGSAHSSGQRASAPTALTVAGYGPGGTFLCPVWPDLECPGRMAATQAPWGPRCGADQLSPDRQSPIPQTSSPPFWASFVSRLTEPAQKARTLVPALPQPMWVWGQVTSFTTGPSEDQAVSGTEEAPGPERKRSGADWYLFLPVLGEKQPRRQTSRPRRRKTKARR